MALHASWSGRASRSIFDSNLDLDWKWGARGRNGTGYAAFPDAVLKKKKSFVPGSASAALLQPAGLASGTPLHPLGKQAQHGGVNMDVPSGRGGYSVRSHRCISPRVGMERNRSGGYIPEHLRV